MSIINILLKIAGKDNTVFDNQISSGYIIKLCWKYGWMMLRGIFFSLGSNSISRKVFIGKKVIVLEKRNLVVGNNTKIHDHVYLDALSTDGIILGDNVVIGRNSRLECTGSIKAIGKGIKIGNNSTFGSDCYFGAAGGITVGSDVVAGQYIRFHSENHNYDKLDMLIREQGESHKGIIIGNNCWIGAGVVFLDGAELGDGCVVGANAVITGRFPNNSVIGGVPAKIIKYRGNSGEKANNNNCADL